MAPQVPQAPQGSFPGLPRHCLLDSCTQEGEVFLEYRLGAEPLVHGSSAGTARAHFTQLHSAAYSLDKEANISS